MQACISVHWGSDATCDRHVLGDQCGEQRGPDLKHSTTRKKAIPALEDEMPDGLSVEELISFVINEFLEEGSSEMSD